MDLDTLLNLFEAGTLPRERWTHAAHLAVGSAYVHAFGESAALTLMRERVRAYNSASGTANTATSGYHEKLTVFWIKVLAALRERHPVCTRDAFAELAVECFGTRRDLFGDFYDFDVVRSLEARRAWVEPARPLDGFLY